MAGQENCARETRAAAKKRAAAAMAQQPQPLNFHPNKKRVALGELPNIPNVWSGFNLGCQSEDPKCDSNAVAAKEAVPGLTGDPHLCFPYAADIFEHLRNIEREVKRRPLPDYIERVQKDVTANMRGILVDWLVEVAVEYNLCSETLYLTVSYIDRYLSLKSLHRRRLQLLAVSAMLIASKYEETKPPKVEDFCYITEDNYTRDQIVKMEADILKSLNFELGTPTSKTFLRTFTSIAQDSSKASNMQLEFLSDYLLELSLLDYACVRFLPSLVAASVTFLSKFTIQPKLHPWSSSLQCYSGYKPSDLKKCVLIIQDLQLSRKGSSLLAVREKYRQSEFKCVANLSCPSEIPASYFGNAE